MEKDFIALKDYKPRDIEKFFKLTDDIKKNSKKYSQKLKGKSIGLVFQKPSNRTRVSFEVGVWQLGGNCIYLGPDEIKLGKRETTKDVAQTLSRYLDGIVARTFSHKDIVDLAKNSSIPVINGLSDLLHPCQALADAYTIREKLKTCKGKTLAYVGDGNNVCHSLAYACALAGINLKIATPKEYEPINKVIKEAQSLAKNTVVTSTTASNWSVKTVKGADVVYTDVWTSMGQEKESAKRMKAFKGFQVNKNLVSNAKKNYKFMHCLPAHHGEEVADNIMESKHSIVFDQAENRMHVQKAILVSLLGGK